MLFEISDAVEIFTSAGFIYLQVQVTFYCLCPDSLNCNIS